MKELTEQEVIELTGKTTGEWIADFPIEVIQDGVTMTLCSLSVDECGRVKPIYMGVDKGRTYTFCTDKGENV
jgi:hypothetical protein